MNEHRVTTPLDETTVRRLQLEDHVYLNGTLFGIRDATQIRIFDEGVPPPVDLTELPAFILHRVSESVQTEHTRRSPLAQRRARGWTALSLDCCANTASGLWWEKLGSCGGVWK